MNFQQLRIIRETVRQNFNLTEASAALYTSQSGVSKHIKDLEDELGVQLFIRKGKRLLGLTEPGQALLGIVERMLVDADNIKRLADDFNKVDEGTLTIATTHTQARYVLPWVVQRFKQQFPNVHLILHQADPESIANMVAQGQADIGIATESLLAHDNLHCIRYYDWYHHVIVPVGHELENHTEIDIQTLANYPIITYHGGFTGRGAIDRAFSAAQLTPNIVLTALDADVISTYVGIGMGVGTIAEMAFEGQHYRNLVKIPTKIFGKHVTWIATRVDGDIRNFGKAFIDICQQQFG